MAQSVHTNIARAIRYRHENEKAIAALQLSVKEVDRLSEVACFEWQASIRLTRSALNKVMRFFTYMEIEVLHPMARSKGFLYTDIWEEDALKRLGKPKANPNQLTLPFPE